MGLGGKQVRLRDVIIGSSLLVASCGAAFADTTFAFSNTTFTTTIGGSQVAGSLTGTFTTNDALSAVLSYDITASPVGSFLGFHYQTTNSSVTASTLPSQYFRIDSTGSANELQIYFTKALTMTGSTGISATFSYEHEPSGGNRYPSGTVSAVAAPGPVAGADLIPLLGLAGGWLARRRRKALAA